jgi:hypothetical protein
MNGNQGVSPSLPGLPKDMGQDRNEEVHIKDADDLLIIVIGDGLEGLENRTGIILKASPIIGIFGMFQGQSNVRIDLQIPEDIGSNGLRCDLLDFADGNHPDRSHGRAHSERYAGI